jgi:hypothetical protein
VLYSLATATNVGNSKAAELCVQHLPLEAVDTGQVGTVAAFRAPAGVVLEHQGVLAQGALVAGVATVVDELTPAGVTPRDGAA